MQLSILIPCLCHCRRSDVGDLYMRQDAVRPSQKYRSGGARAARHHSGATKGLCQGDLRRKLCLDYSVFRDVPLTTMCFYTGNERMLGTRSRRATRLPHPQGSAGLGRTRTDRLNKQTTNNKQTHTSTQIRSANQSNACVHETFCIYTYTYTQNAAITRSFSI